MRICNCNENLLPSTLSRCSLARRLPRSLRNQRCAKSNVNKCIANVQLDARNVFIRRTDTIRYHTHVGAKFDESGCVLAQHRTQNMHAYAAVRVE